MKPNKIQERRLAAHFAKLRASDRTTLDKDDLTWLALKCKFPLKFTEAERRFVKEYADSKMGPACDEEE